jgi:hypothetical protein
MMTRSRLLSAWAYGALLLAIYATSANAFTVAGFGGQTCGKWVEDRASLGAMAELDEAWVLGFVSASNKPFLVGTNVDILKGVDNAGAFAWLDGYCAKHPLDLIADAAGRLVDFLATRAAPR